MSNREWYIVYTRKGEFLSRYLIEHNLMPYFGDETDVDEWLQDMKKYFVERTAIKDEIIAIELSEVTCAYPYRATKERLRIYE